MDLEIMAQILLTLISVGASTLCAYLLYCLQERNKRREELEREREHEYREAQAKQESEYAALRKGVCAVLRDRIVQSAIYFRSQGYANAAQKDNINKMYAAYHALGGNGTATHALEDILDLPFEPDGR